ncbi:Nitrite transporter NirC [Caloramator mitchellensis]|uniref:Nitrite transporter NirC n=1 Tax=Caloramator mitchellensis TaxID=908809 RepID=A0A0R3K038_CALMK|nr:formate/nitrite transporter family protein [Caloramator mitchellensis]KRQ86756.1 Nitrite transporter NirC [Caloramator mitchellensis]
MFGEEINKVSNAALAKVNFLNSGKTKYILSSMLAGIYVGFGILLIFTIGGLLSQANSPSTRIVMGVSFGIALSLVIMAGSELFTGNNFVMTIGLKENTISFKNAVRIWVYSFLGNWIGAILISVLFVFAGLAKGPTIAFIQKVSIAKTTLPFVEILVRGILCNVLVCLGVWMSFKLKEETAKLIMIFWCLFAFITTGYEHSIANMTLLTTSIIVPHDAGLNISGYFLNIFASTLGNFIGGSLLGLSYWFISKKN